jgi:N-acetylglucosamine-6-phosphate deacetylase
VNPPTSPHCAGLFDLQVNGFAGVDFQQDDIPLAMLEYAMHGLHAHRTTRILYTLITDRVDILCRRLEHVEALRSRSPILQETIAGYHLEGPWLSPKAGYHGAHNPGVMVAPSFADADRLIAASGGNLRLVTLAPERAGSDEITAHLIKHGVRVAAGHCNPSDDEIDRAIAAGLTLCTHLGNAVPALLPRHDNIIQRLLARDELTAVFIPDGIHLPPATLKNFVRAKPRNRVLFTTDCMAAAGAPAGRYTLGTIQAEVGGDGVVREPGKPNFSGSSLTMDCAVRNVVRHTGWSIDEAEAACSTHVATTLGLPALHTPSEFGDRNVIDVPAG